MGKLRHIAVQVPDLEKAAAFYEGAFELKRVSQVESPIGNAISLSDGIMNLTLLHFPEGTKGGKGGPAFLRTHPVDEVRIKQIQEWLPAAKAEQRSDVISSPAR